VNDVFEKITEAQTSRTAVVLCVVVSTQGSTPRQAGAKMLVYKTGKIFGTIGGGTIEKKVIANALSVLEHKKPETFRYDLLKENMCCGGSMAVYIEPIMVKNKLYIFGAGHTGNALAKCAQDLGFEIVIIDDRSEYLDEIKLPDILKMHGGYKEVLQQLSFDENTFITIMTYSHTFDREILAYCIDKPWGYLGMIGSQRKVEMTKKAFIQDNICTKEELERVDMPMGINIGAEGPEEIAISILSKIIAVKNKIKI